MHNILMCTGGALITLTDVYEYVTSDKSRTAK